MNLDEKESHQVRNLAWNKQLTSEKNTFITMLACTRFSTNNLKNPIKIKKPAFVEDVKLAWEHGALAISETLLNQYKNGEHKSINDIIWDLLTVMKYSHDSLRKEKVIAGEMPNQSLTELWDMFQPTTVKRDWQDVMVEHHGTEWATKSYTVEDMGNLAKVINDGGL